MNATPQFLLEGAYYALIQCGRLLNSAAILYKAGDHATAVGLAALAREELGRSDYLRDQRKEVVKGKTVSVEEIREACKDHLMKQERGQGAVMQRFSVNSGFGNLLWCRHRADPQSKERREYDQQVDELTERQQARTPQERHDERMKAFYVEPNAAGTDWNKPWEKDKEEAKHFVQDAINNYAVQVNSVWLLDVLKHTDPELAQAVEDWKARPDLPRPLLLVLEEVSNGKQAHT